jgi:hypothetical protein
MASVKEDKKEIQKVIFELIQNNELEDAANLSQTLLEDDPNDPIALNFLGIVHLELHNFPLAYQ